MSFHKFIKGTYEDRNRIHAKFHDALTRVHHLTIHVNHFLRL